MAYNTKSIIKDVNKKPVPQYWNPITQQYEVITGKHGRWRRQRNSISKLSRPNKC